MKKLTAAQIIERLQTLSEMDKDELIKVEGITELDYVPDFSLDSFAYCNTMNPLPMEIGVWEEIEQVGGEDEGSTWYSVKYFKDHDVYIRTDGFYQSYHGTDFNYGFGKEVKPKKKTITVFE